jgi:hypothetical protein
LTKLADQVQITLTISDAGWPQLKAVGQRQGTCGVPAVITETQQYDLAYGKFEVILHNLLRPAVDAIIAKRKGPK